MRKTRLGFWIITILVAIAAVVSVFISPPWGVFGAVAVVLGWSAFFVHFRTIEYVAEKERIIIREGFFIKSETIIRKSDILWESTVKIGSCVVFSAIHTAAGRVFLFCDLHQEVF